MNERNVEAICWCIFGCASVVSLCAVILVGYAIEKGVI